MNRMKGEGTIRRRPSGCYELRVMHGYREDGKPKFKYFYGKTKKEVQEQLDSFKEDIRHGIDLKHDYTVEEWSNLCLERHIENIAPATYEHYRFLLIRSNKFFGFSKLREIKTVDIDDFIKHERANGYSDSHLWFYYADVRVFSG